MLMQTGLAQLVHGQRHEAINFGVSTQQVKGQGQGHTTRLKTDLGAIFIGSWAVFGVDMAWHVVACSTG